MIYRLYHRDVDGCILYATLVSHQESRNDKKKKSLVAFHGALKTN